MRMTEEREREFSFPPSSKKKTLLSLSHPLSSLSLSLQKTGLPGAHRDRDCQAQQPPGPGLSLLGLSAEKNEEREREREGEKHAHTSNKPFSSLFFFSFFSNTRSLSLSLSVTKLYKKIALSFQEFFPGCVYICAAPFAIATTENATSAVGSATATTRSDLPSR